MTSALRWAAMRAILMFHNCEGQSHKTVFTDHNFWRERRAEADSNWIPSAYQPYRQAKPAHMTHIANKQWLYTVSKMLISPFRRRHKWCCQRWSSRLYKGTQSVDAAPQSAGAVWKSRRPFWAPRPNEPYGFCGRKATLNHAYALVTFCH